MEPRLGRVLSRAVGRPHGLSILVCFAFFVVLSLSEVTCVAADPPNIILMMADDLGWGDVGFNGNKFIKTPNLDAMAAAGLKFNRFYAAAPVCSPTRGSCVTGRHPFRYGIYSANVGHMRAEEITLAEFLREQLGYATGHFGKWHLGTLTKTEQDSNRGGPRGAKHFSPPWQNGFDVCFSTEAKVPTWDPLLRPKSAKGNTWWNPIEDASEANPYGTAYWSNGERVNADLRGDDSRLIMDRALTFIESAVTERNPFFTIVWFHAPHLPVVAGPKYTSMYSEHDKHSQHYFGCITALDEQVRRLRNRLRELKVSKNTMLWFCSDNGPEGNQKAPGSTAGLRGRKRSLFEGGVRVPGILEWPARVKAGRVSDIPACTSDYLPTIVDAVMRGRNVAWGKPIDGISLMPLIDGTMSKRPTRIGFQSAEQLSLIDNRFKLIHVPAKRNKKSSSKNIAIDGMDFMLFDIVKDPDEQNDIAGDHPQVVENMKMELKNWRASCLRSLDGRDK